MRVATITVLTADTFATGVTATGFNTSADALEMPADFCQVTAMEDTTNFQSGLRIPSDAGVGDTFGVVNMTTAILRVYPATGGAFLSGGAIVDQASFVGNNQTATVKCVASGEFAIYLSN